MSLLHLHYGEDLNESTVTFVDSLFSETLREELRLRRSEETNPHDASSPDHLPQAQTTASPCTATPGPGSTTVTPPTGRPILTQGRVDLSAIYDDRTFRSPAPEHHIIPQAVNPSYDPGHVGTIIRWDATKGYGFIRCRWPRGIDPHKGAKHTDHNMYFNHNDIDYRSSDIKLGDVVEFYSYRSKKSWCAYRIWVVYSTSNDQCEWVSPSHPD